MTIKEETMQLVADAKTIENLRLDLIRELESLESSEAHPVITGSIVDYRDRSNQDLQDLCNDIDFDFMDLDGECIDRLQSMECDTDRIQWLTIVRREREEGA